MSLAVVGLSDVQARIAACRRHTLLVIQLPGVRVQAAARTDPARVIIKLAAKRQRHILPGAQRAVAVIEFLRVQLQIGFGSQHAVVVINILCLNDGFASPGQHPLLVSHLARRYVQIAKADHAAAGPRVAVAEGVLLRVQAHIAAGLYQPAIVIHRSAGDGEDLPSGGEQPLLVIQRADRQLSIAFRRHAALRVIEPAAAKPQRAYGLDAAAFAGLAVAERMTVGIDLHRRP